MAYNEQLADRIRAIIYEYDEFIEKKMFGGLAFMHHGNMCVGVIGDQLMARVGPDQYEIALKKKHAREMDFTGKALKGFVYVSTEGVKTKKMLTDWITTCINFTDTLPEK